MMKRIICVLIVIFVVVSAGYPYELPADADKEIEMTSREKPQQPVRPRAPMRVDLKAYYYAGPGLIEVVYNGAAEGVVNLYLDGMLIDHAEQLNCSFQVKGGGFYEIEVVTDSWIAAGQFTLN
ncbi:MAG: hypothetical protein K2J03_02990 [Muribaculaceae bacterium]|nr:hypothetical protein [Muribaculaceae bacterium]